MIQNEIIEVSGCRWKIREAVSMKEAEYAIASSRCSGAVGTKHVLNETYVGGGITVLADVVQVNSDDTERKPYTDAY